MDHIKENITGPRVKEMNIYAFGDIHGEFFKLKNLVGRIFPKKGDTLVFLGDYIDRGKYTFEVIEYLINLNKKHNCVFLMGNHEGMLMDYVCGINVDIFMYNGGVKTTKSYKEHGFPIGKDLDYTERILPKEHIEFFKGLKKYYETEDYVFVHAVIHPGTPLENQPDEILLWGREFSFINYHGKVVVYGHYPRRQILNEKYKICIDTGACFESMGELTCVKLPEREFIKQGPVLEDLA